MNITSFLYDIVVIIQETGLPVLKHRPPSPEAPVPVFGTGREKIPSPTIDTENPSDNNKALAFSKSILLRPPSGPSLLGEASAGINTVKSTMPSFVVATNAGDNLTADEKKEARALKFQTLSSSRPAKRPASSDNIQESAKV